MLINILTVLPLSFLCVLAQLNQTASIVKPVLARNFPDPTVVAHGGSWFAFSTSSNKKNVQAAVSADFIKHNWRILDDVDALPDPGPWAMNDQNIWAPDVIQLVSHPRHHAVYADILKDDFRWIMYYAAPVKSDPSKHCIGAGYSNNILGPYQPLNEPIACPLDRGGAIDPEAFKDPRTGHQYIIYKVDGNSLNNSTGPCRGTGNPKDFHATPILAQQVNTKDGVTPIGSPFQLIDRDAEDGPLVEAPSIFYNCQCGYYFLTFSSNCFETESYDIKYAYSKNLPGPYRRGSAPLMSTIAGPVSAPGGADMISNGTFAVFHGTVEPDENGGLTRHMYAAESQQISNDMSAWLLP